jgi:hypothetical protein
MCDDQPVPVAAVDGKGLSAGKRQFEAPGRRILDDPTVGALHPVHDNLCRDCADLYVGALSPEFNRTAP